MARTKPTPQKQKPEFRIRAVSLTPDVDEALQRLSQDASDFIGRAVSESAIVRALVRQAVQQGPPVADALFVLVEKELKSGIQWGKKARTGESRSR
jgi:hypothetical protein